MSVRADGWARAPDVELSLDGALKAPGRARDALATWLGPSLDVSVDDVILAASELVSNVVRHAGGTGLMRVWAARGSQRLRLEVHDNVPDVPVLSQGRRYGYGLRIVDALATSWGVERVDGGKVVWAEFDRRGTSANA